MRVACTLPALLLFSGCLSPWNTRLPEVMPRGAEYERREAQIQDPYPDERIGPDTGFRPLQYEQQRSEVQSARDRNYASFLRQQFGVQGTPAPPPAGATAPQYPHAVRQ
ncbi:hypothetical protein [Maioricimonas sp. JC845]|uniref:hypothetical protein n=1 Tax=Maioricimonas sp. JC845 TaxID=3232138 RepID=UPI0034594BC9